MYFFFWYYFSENYSIENPIVTVCGFRENTQILRKKNMLGKAPIAAFIVWK